MKKTIINILVAISIMISASSCEEWLDVQPRTKIKSDQVFEKPIYFEQALMGIYLSMAEKNLYGQELTFYFMDAAGGLYDLKAGSVSDSKYYYANKRKYSDSGTKAIISSIWSNAYNSIANINNLLENIDKQSVVPEVTANMIKGEAAGLRAFLHFDLLRMFGPSMLNSDVTKLDKKIIPYVSVYEKNLSPQLTVAETLVKIHADLDVAIELLETNDPWGINKVKDVDDYEAELFYMNRNFRFNYWAAVATKARVLMWEGRYEEALVLAEAFIAESEIKFVKESDLNKGATASGVDRTFSREYIFGLDVNNLFISSNIKSFLGASGVTISNKLMYIKSDRFKEIFETESIGLSDLRQVYKFEDSEFDKVNNTYAEDEKVGNRVALIRKPEMFYMAAECLNRLEIRRDDAIKYLNLVRISRTLVDALSPDLTQAEISQEIEKEYYKDFFGEGQIFYYLKRLGITSLPYTAESANEESYIFPIPQDEIDFGRESNVENVN